MSQKELPLKSSHKDKKVAQGACHRLSVGVALTVLLSFRALLASCADALGPTGFVGLAGGAQSGARGPLHDYGRTAAPRSHE